MAFVDGYRRAAEAMLQQSREQIAAGIDRAIRRDWTLRFLSLAFDLERTGCPEGDEYAALVEAHDLAMAEATRL